MMTAIESLRTGSTTIVDDMSLGQSFDRGHVEAALQAYDDAGIAVLSRLLDDRQAGRR